MNADDPAKNQYCSFTQLLLPHGFGYLSRLNQQNQNNAGTYITNHEQPLPARDYFKLTVDYLPHEKLQSAKVKEWLVKKVEHVDNLNETDIFLLLMLVYQTSAYKTILYLHSSEWPERLFNGMIM